MYMTKQGAKQDYFYKEFMLDSKDELKDINTDACCPGSVAYVMTTGDVYMLKSNKEWEAQ